MSLTPWGQGLQSPEAALGGYRLTRILSNLTAHVLSPGGSLPKPQGILDCVTRPFIRHRVSKDCHISGSNWHTWGFFLDQSPLPITGSLLKGTTWPESPAGKALASHVADPSSISRTPYCLLSPARSDPSTQSQKSALGIAGCWPQNQSNQVNDESP